MVKYMHRIPDVETFDEIYNSASYEEPWVSYIDENQRVDYNNPDYDEALYRPLTFEVLTGGTINWIANNSGFVSTIEYNKNGTGWQTITSKTGSTASSTDCGGAKINVVAGDIVQFRGNNDYYCCGATNYNTFGGSASYCNIKGNIMSLIDSVNYPTLKTFPSGSQRNFNGLFRQHGNYFYPRFVDASELILPATALTEYCYANMFYGYNRVLTAGPELPATTLATGCYSQMFSRTSLPIAPVLPALTLVNNCYYMMFGSCSSLTYVKCLALDISANNCIKYLFDGVSQAGTFVKHPNNNDWPRGSSGIPNNWTIEDAVL